MQSPAIDKMMSSTVNKSLRRAKLPRIQTPCSMAKAIATDLPTPEVEETHVLFESHGTLLTKY